MEKDNSKLGELGLRGVAVGEGLASMRGQLEDRLETEGVTQKVSGRVVVKTLDTEAWVSISPRQYSMSIVTQIIHISETIYIFCLFVFPFLTYFT